MDIKSKSNWRLWCRLCTKDDATNITNMLLKTEEKANENELENQLQKQDDNQANKELVAAIEKYFSVNLQDNEELPKSLCSECFTFVKTLLVFMSRVTKAQQFFLILQQTNEDVQSDANALRLKYGLLNENIVRNQLPEVHYFDTKPETNDVSEENIYEPETIITDPLEVPKLRLRIKLEKTETNKLDGNVVRTIPKITGLNINEEATTKQCLGNEKSEEYTKMKLRSKMKNKISKKLSGRKTSAALTKKRRCSSSSDSIANDEHNAESTTDPIEKPKKSSSKETATNKTQLLLSCDECAMRFKRSNGYQRHMKEVHDKEVPSTYTCPHCSRVYQQYYKLRNHMIVHKPVESRRVVPCPHCDKKFTSTNLVEIHINYIHNDVRPFICEQCGETYHTNAQLRHHILTHTDYSPFQCEICKKGFKEKSGLKKHMHIHDPIKPICIECGLQFSTPFTLKRHMLVHSSEMQHKCDHCGRAFKRAKTLKNHLLLHAGLKPYICNFCDRTFASGANCRTHKKRAHPEELAALEATGAKITNKLNIPRLKALKALTKTSENLLPVVSKQSGCFAKDPSEKNQPKDELKAESKAKTKADLPAFVPPNQYINYMFMLPPSTT